MSYDTDNILSPAEALEISAPLPPDLVLTNLILRELRAYLKSRRLEGYQIFHCDELDLYDIDRHLESLGESSAAWELAAVDAVAQAIPVLCQEEKAYEMRHAGCLHLRRHQLVLANWRWMCVHDAGLKEFWLCAASSVQQYARVRQTVRKLRRAAAASVWQVVSGAPWYDGPRTPRELISTDDLVLSASIRNRIQVDIISFFDDKVAAMYAAMRVPHRRGVLLHGPPGNGKTSLIRAIGAELPDVPVLILRPSTNFDSDRLQTVLRRWTRQAPAILVIEDLNWLLKSIDVSLLLNLLDGIDSRATAGGLMLIATTNYPEELDPALNNRPGRFDVVLEVPPPDAAARRQFLSQRLDDVDSSLLGQLVEMTDRHSFAHLEELLRTSGLLAIHAGREKRTEQDLLMAARSLREASDAARRGFPAKAEVPFGLDYLRKISR